ncbi:Oligopeptide transport system permease protein OppC [Candidatus Entotheonellaceae bacterium PAL068K]
MTATTGHSGASASPSASQLALRRFGRNTRAMLSLVGVVLIGLGTLVVPLVSPHAYDEPDWNAIQGQPNGTYWFGTDALGRDLLVRAFIGGRISFAVGLLATVVAVLIGVAYGAIAGYLGGRVDLLMMRISDLLYGLPYLLIVIIAMTLFESRSFVLVFLVLGLFSWLTLSRIVRGQVLSLREREFVEAARALGVGTAAILVRHLLPNFLGPVIVYTTLTIPSAMLSEAFLSFLGLGISEPLTSWGVLISEGANAMSSEGISWWLIVFPGALFTFTLYGLNSVGDGIRDAFDVQQP